LKHRNLSTRTSMFALVQQTFFGKNLVKSMMISTLDKVIYYKGTFYRAQWNLSLQYKIGWRPAEKNCRFFQHASSSTKIFMISSQNSEKNKKRKLCLNESFWVLLDQNLRCSVGNWLWIIIQGCRMVYFQTKNPIWINFGGSCNRTSCYILWPLGLFYKYLVYFMVIWYVLWSLGAHLFPFWYDVSRKIWPPCDLSSIVRWLRIFFTPMYV
jgi:hypothetical protein